VKCLSKYKHQSKNPLPLLFKTRRLNFNRTNSYPYPKPTLIPFLSPKFTRISYKSPGEPQRFLHTTTTNYCSKDEPTLSHVDSQGKVKMVDVSDKKVTNREAVAEGLVVLNESAFKAVTENKLKKGDVLTIAQIAGILGAKQTSNLIPLCHPLPLSRVDVLLTLEPNTRTIRIKCLAKTTSNTGVEMEALTAVAISALTIYDMCKAVDKGIIIQDIRLLKKMGGKTDFDGESVVSSNTNEFTS